MAKKRVKKKRGKIATDWKFRVTLKKLVSFAILFVLSFVLFRASTSILYQNLFFLLSFIFGFITLAFVIVYLILFLLKKMKA